MTDVDVENGTDAAGALGKVDSIKLTWDDQDVKFFFSELEGKFELIEIKSQWTKRHVLANLLPPKQKAEVKDLLMKSKTQAGTDIYKKLKDRILELFGPRQEEAFEEAMQLVLTGKPSALAKKLINKLCKTPSNHFESCCCEGTVMAMWKRKLPQVVRASIAGKSLTGEVNQRDVLKLADDVFAAAALPSDYVVAAPVQAHPTEVAAVAAADLDTSADLPALQIAAAAYTRARAQRAGQSATAQQKPKNRGKPHPDGPPENTCYLHWKHGKSAYKCQRPGSCPWKEFTIPKPK